MTNNSCLQCKFYPRCNDPHKSRNHVCEDFKPQEIKESAFIFQQSSTKIITPNIIVADEEYDKQELGLVKMLDSILQPGSMVPFDLKIDDRDLKEFPNFYSFCFSKDGADQAPYARQLAVATHLLGEWCPDCSSPAFKDINRVPVGYLAFDFPEKVQFLEYGKCPKCGTTKSELVRQRKLHAYQELAACIGQRGGKSSISTLIAAYLLHKYLKLQKPNEVFGLMRNTILIGTVAALTYGKAVELLWLPLHSVITNSKWFTDYHAMLDSYADKYGDEELYKFKDTIIHYKHRGLLLHPSGPSKRTMRGATRWLCLTGDTLVNTDQGLLPIRDESIVGTTTYFGTAESRKIIAHAYAGVKNVFTVRLKNGLCISGSSNHPILTWNEEKLDFEWIAISDLSLNTAVACSYGGQFPETLLLGGSKHVGLPARLSVDLAYVVGYLASSTVTCNDKGLSFALSSSKKVQDFTQRFLRVFGSVHGYPYFYTTFYLTHDDEEVHQIVISNQYAPILSALGLFKKSVPWCIMQAPRACVLGFIDALIPDTWDIEIKTHRYLLKDLQLLFFRLGYVCSRKDTLRFDSCATSNVFKSEFQLDRQPCCGISFSKVAKIKPRGKKKTYDIQVDSKDCCFTANGICSHNSLIDELGWFDNSEEGSRKERASATEVYTALDRSLKTVRNKAKKLLSSGFNNIPTAYAINISSPSSQTDKIMSLVRTHAGSSEVYTVHLPTWKFNPEYKRSDFAKEYRDNPINAERDFGANPPMSENPFIHDISKLKGLMLRKPNRVRYRYVVTKTHGRDKAEKHATLIKVNTAAGITHRSIMAIDAGVSNNSFAVVVGHVLVKDDVQYRVIDTMLEIAPRRNQDEINFARVAKNIIEPLIEELNVGWVVADRWNSIKLLDDLRDNCDVETEIYSLAYSDLMYVREFLTEDHPTVRIPKVEMDYEEIMRIDLESYPHCFRYQPVSHFIFQCGTVVDWGNSVQKASGLTDDLFRSTALCLAYLLDTEFVEKNLLYKEETRGKRFLGVFAGTSSGGGTGATNLGKIGAMVSRGGSSGVFAAK